jgi:D-lactate dehydrogenase (cytochrome)
VTRPALPFPLPESFRVVQADDPDAPFLRDESSYSGNADTVVEPSGALDLDALGALFRGAQAAGVPITLSARRTSLTGAAVPEGGLVVVLPTVSGREYVRIDRPGLRATADAQVFMVDVAEAAEAADAFFPPDPTSRKTCSLGGAIACNASGARSFRHGPTGAFVEALRIVLPTGEQVTLQRGAHPPRDGHFTLELPGRTLRVPAPPPRSPTVKSSLGYATWDPPDLVDLFIGSEGTLGYIAEATVRLLPGCRIFAALALFRREADAIALVERLQGETTALGVRPLSVEWFDRHSLTLAAARHPRLGGPADVEAALLLEEDHAPEVEDAVVEAWYTLLTASGVPDDAAYLRVPSNRAQHEALRDFRHAVPESINALARQRGLRKLGTDLAWPRAALRPMFALYARVLDDLPAALGPEVCAAFEAAHGRPFPTRLDHATFGHAGDSHLHVNLLPRDPAEMAAGRVVYDFLSRACAAAGGSISGEHGIGKSKRAMLAEVAPPEVMRTMRAIKRAFDPAGVLARGNVLDLGDRRA